MGTPIRLDGKENMGLHYGNQVYVEIKDEITRVVDSGFFGKVEDREKDDHDHKGRSPMEVDNLTELELACLKGKGNNGGKGWGSKGL